MDSKKQRNKKEKVALRALFLLQIVLSRPNCPLILQVFPQIGILLYLKQDQEGLLEYPLLK